MTHVNGEDGFTWYFALGYACKDRGKPHHEPPPVLRWGITDAVRCAVLTSSPNNLQPPTNHCDATDEYA